MKFRNISIAVLSLVALSVFGFAMVSNAAASARFTLSTNKMAYDFGEEIMITLRAQNTGDTALTLAFPRSCQADYIIDDLAKTDLVCENGINEVIIEAGKVYEWTFTNKPGQGDDPVLYPGSHNIRAVLIGYPTTEATQSITVDYAETAGVGQYCGSMAEAQCPSGLTCDEDGGYCYNATLPEPAKGELATEEESDFSDVTPTHWANVYINLLSDNSLIQGYDDGTFRPDNFITRAELTKMSLMAAGIEAISGIDGSFIDLDEWQVSWVYTAQDMEIVEGYTPRQFDPNRPINRAEAVKIMLLSFGAEQAVIDEAVSLALPFPDVGNDAWFKAYVAYAYDNKILSGYPDGTFKPANFITRAEAAKIIANLWEGKNS